MCGIFGIAQAKHNPIDLTKVQCATTAMRHRGPDDEGYLLVNTGSGRVVTCGGPDTDPGLSLPSLTDFTGEAFDLALGFRRLAIMDLSPAGHQPMASQDGRYWIDFNGEVYNFVELRQELSSYGHRFRSGSDTEVILAAYQQWGPACVQRFNGMWAFAILDLPQQKLFCSRDRMGIKPFHYFFDGEHFAFSSEIKPLLQIPFIPKKINERAVYEYLAYAAVEYCDETFFAQIMNLLPGYSLTLDLRAHTLDIQPYYQPKFTINEKLTLPEAAAEFRRLLTDSVRVHLRSDVEVGSCLSGGLDSSSLVCLMQQMLREEDKSHIQHTFSSHFEEKEANELEYMQTVIKATGVQAHFTYPKPADLLHDLEQLVWHQEEPFGSTSIFAQWSVFKLVHEHKIKVMLDGQGADEMLGGYIPLTKYFFQELRAKGQYGLLLREMWQHRQLYQSPWSDLVPRRVQNIVKRFLPSAGGQLIAPKVDWLSPRLTQAYGGQSLYLANSQQNPFGAQAPFSNVLYQLTFLNNLQSLLKYEDRNSMAFSVEARVPFLDYRLVEFVFQLPSTVKVQGGFTKRVMREAMAGILPEKIRWRVGKLGFATPEQTWEQNVLQPLIEQAVRDEKLQPYIQPEQALAYWKAIRQTKRQDSTPWRWVNLSLWMKVYNLA